MTSDPPSDKVSEGLYVSKLQDSSQSQTVVALHNQENLRGGGKRDYHRLRMCCGRNKRKGTKFLLQVEDRRVLSVEGKWVLFKRRIL